MQKYAIKRCHFFRGAPICHPRRAFAVVVTLHSLGGRRACGVVGMGGMVRCSASAIPTVAGCVMLCARHADSRRRRAKMPPVPPLQAGGKSQVYRMIRRLLAKKARCGRAVCRAVRVRRHAVAFLRHIIRRTPRMFFTYARRCCRAAKAMFMRVMPRTRCACAQRAARSSVSRAKVR